jgi:hypothetical protein
LAIITTAQYKTFAGISASTYDAQLDVIIPALEDLVLKWLGRTIATATFTEKHDGNGTDALVLRNPPIASVTSVTLIFGSDTVALASTDFAFSTTGTGRLWLLSTAWWTLDRTGAPRFPVGRENISVVYVGGYATAPAGLQLAMYRLTAITLAQAGIDTTLKSTTLGQFSETRFSPSELSAAGGAALSVATDVQQMLAAYRRVPEF